jgi:hypothetical protein
MSLTDSTVERNPRRTPRTTDGVDRLRRRVVAVLLASAATASAVNLLARPVPALDSGNYGLVAPVRDGYWTFAVVGAVATALAFLSLGLAVCLLVRGAGA